MTRVERPTRPPAARRREPARSAISRRLDEDLDEDDGRERIDESRERGGLGRHRLTRAFITTTKKVMIIEPGSIPRTSTPNGWPHPSSTSQ